MISSVMMGGTSCIQETQEIKTARGKINKGSLGQTDKLLEGWQLTAHSHTQQPGRGWGRKFYMERATIEPLSANQRSVW